MSKHYSSDNECILTGGLWALIAAMVIAGISMVFVDFWPTAIVIFAVVLLAGLIAAFFICKMRTVSRGVDVTAIDLARAEMGIATPDNAADVAEAEDNAEAEMEAAEEEKVEAEAAEHDHEGEAKPELLTEARDGKADDLKKIKGVGPKLEKELHAAGVFHFDQIAGWSAEEVLWADQHLVSFKGRVTRDDWVDQAKALAK